MGYRLIISVSILSLLLTACFGAADGPNETAAGPDAAAGQPVKEQPELSVLPLTDSGLSMLVEDNTCFPGLPGDLEPADDCYGFPVELVSDLKYRMNQEDADACIEYLDGMNQQDFRIANHEFLSLLDMTDEMTNKMAITDFNENEAEYSCYRCDTDGDGTDELIAFEKDGRGTISYVHMMVEGENGYVFFNSQYMDDVRFFTLFQYESAFYYGASCFDDSTGTVNLQIYMLDRTIFHLANITDSICFNRTFRISEPHLLYRNEQHPDIHIVQDYLDDVIYDVIYANRAKNTFYGDEWEYRNEERPFLYDDTAYREDAEDADAINWSHMYIMDINNDGKDEIFTKTPPGYRQPFEHSIKWYHKDFKQCPAAVEAWKDNHYRLVDMWFKHFNGKAAAFTLYQEIQSGQRYLVDARIQEDGQTTILMDYMAVLEPDDIRVTEFGVGTDVSIYKPLTYQDPSRDSAFPYNLPDVAEVFLLKVQGSSAAIENNCADIPDDFTEILAGLLADKALDRLERGLGMEMYQTDQGDFERKYGTYLSQARRTLNGGTQYVCRISLGPTDYFLLLQYSVTGKIGDLHIYRETAGGLAYVSTYQPEYLGGKIICHSGGLYIVERPFPGGERPRYLDNIMIHRLIPEGGQDAVIEAVPESFMWQKIYDNRAAYVGDVTGYLEEIKTDLADLSYRSNDEDVYTGDEDPEIELNQFLRLGSVVSPYETFYKIDFNNDRKDEYISKEKSYNHIYAGIYQFTGRGIVGLEYDETAEEAWGHPVQIWFKEIQGKVFTFRLFYHEDSYYVLNVSLIEGTRITQVQTHIIVPKVNYIMNEY